jgi:hypothetical protein
MLSRLLVISLKRAASQINLNLVAFLPSSKVKSKVRSYIPLEALITIPVPIPVQSAVSLEKKNKAKHAKLMRAVRDQLETLVHISSHLVYLSVHLSA